MKSKNFYQREAKFERAISYLLITGVFLSLLLEAIGLFLYYHQYKHLNISETKEIFIHGKNFFHFIKELFQGKCVDNKAIFFMMLGITILILTPYIRVIMSVVYFTLKGNIKYIIITIFVLIVLTISLMTH